MGNVNWSKTNDFYIEKSALIQSNVGRNDWIGFMDALGWMENGGRYGGISNKGYAGIYQVGDEHLAYYDVLNGLGKQFLGVTTKRGLASNPLAQELAGIMEFSGVPRVTEKAFASNYTAVRSNAARLYQLSNSIFDQLIDKTITITYTDAKNIVVGRYYYLTKAVFRADFVGTVRWGSYV